MAWSAPVVEAVEKKVEKQDKTNEDDGRLSGLDQPGESLFYEDPEEHQP
jgi:hypothetical protein